MNPARSKLKLSLKRQTLTQKEAWEYLGVSEPLLITLLKSGQIASTRLGRRWIIPKSSVDTYLNRISLGDKTNGAEISK
jgi:excisionase family DNA binding protein